MPFDRMVELPVIEPKPIPKPVEKPWVPDPRLIMIRGAIEKLDGGKHWIRGYESLMPFYRSEAVKYCLIGAALASSHMKRERVILSVQLDTFLFSPLCFAPPQMSNDILGYWLGAVPILYGAKLRHTVTDKLARLIRWR